MENPIDDVGGDEDDELKLVDLEVEEDPGGFDMEDMIPRCSKCGCTDDQPCDPPCFWAYPDLCSRCVKQ